jgi:hypothetical protein
MTHATSDDTTDMVCERCREEITDPNDAAHYVTLDDGLEGVGVYFHRRHTPGASDPHYRIDIRR